MVEGLIHLPQFDAYHSSVTPIVQYSRSHASSLYDEDEIKKLLPYAKQTDFILTTFLEIIDDLNYDKEKFENIIYNLDDDYDELSEFTKKLNPKLKIHKELYDMSQNILTNLMKVQNKLGIIVSQNENKAI